ncbi:hypothetical protein CJP74_06450 [Psittacicella melopsittaci]|uniref:Uncharacterized protein n=1 Tax=Psittacicella melopsittaci TaxID=2028576 RepID=A0A3A1Y2T0_9GAMM|nr:hypothetical protein [Psittacicella melopsittaci]RIY31751.1 hypothetical protein CJP74_06450 [Psittacicella melopsittaci]
MDITNLQNENAELKKQLHQLKRESRANLERLNLQLVEYNQAIEAIKLELASEKKNFAVINSHGGATNPNFEVEIRNLQANLNQLKLQLDAVNAQLATAQNEKQKFENLITDIRSRLIRVKDESYKGNIIQATAIVNEFSTRDPFKSLLGNYFLPKYRGIKEKDQALTQRYNNLQKATDNLRIAEDNLLKKTEEYKNYFYIQHLLISLGVITANESKTSLELKLRSSLRPSPGCLVGLFNTIILFALGLFYLGLTILIFGGLVAVLIFPIVDMI